MSSYLITGSSRGIGLGLAKVLAAKSSSEVASIFASSRKQNDDLKQLEASYPGRVHFIQLDATDAQSVKDAAVKVEKLLQGKGLDVLINNAGIMNYTQGTTEVMTDLEETLRANVLSAHLVTSAFIPLLKKGSLKKVANISTTLGSFSLQDRFKLFPVPAYKVSKAALNMLTVQYAQDFAAEGFSIFCLSPGWVKTDLGSGNAELTIDQSVDSILKIVAEADSSSNGKFFDVHVEGWENAQGTLNQYPGGFAAW